MGRKVVIAVSTGAERAVPGPRGQVSMDELARRKGVRPVEDPHTMARDVFASDDELDEFQAFIREARRADLA